MDDVELRTLPEPITVDLDRTAVIVVDMQNDFGSDGGMFHRAGIDIEPIKAIVPAIADVLAAARAAGLPIVYLQQQHASDLSDAGDARSPHYLKHVPLQIGLPVEAPDGTQGRILIAGTWNTAIVDALAPEEGDVMIGKHRFSGFFETRLHDVLQGLGVETLVFVGATTSICVDATVRDAMFRDYTCIVLSDCTAEPLGHDTPRGNHDATLLAVQVLLGWVAESAQFVDALEARRGATV